ncbi:MAG TPA: TadE/TadG family type IV pilus assembly protein [Candidatus Dormibacteraeota bacterium]|nr:TadE/TadG family type IV pilus assembly protein [Candidatus Dormibacteraeota bacterium]
MYEPTRNRITDHPTGQGNGNPARIGQANDGERGTEMLEFAFVISLLMTLLLGIVTFSRAFNVYQTITRAAREGARMAVLPSCASCGNSYLDPSTGVTAANSAVFSGYIGPALQAANLNPNAVLNYSESVGWLDSGDTQEQCGVKISFQYPYQLNLPFTSQNLTTIDIGVHVQMRRENQPTGGTCP